MLVFGILLTPHVVGASPLLEWPSIYLDVEVGWVFLWEAFRFTYISGIRLVAVRIEKTWVSKGMYWGNEKRSCSSSAN